jgi:hypothetical protein
VHTARRIARHADAAQLFFDEAADEKIAVDRANDRSHDSTVSSATRAVASGNSESRRRGS